MANKLILHIEDNPSNRKAVRHILRMTDYELEEAFDGQEGLDKLETLTPDLINDTLGSLLKYQDDIARVQGSEAARLLAEIQAAA